MEAFDPARPMWQATLVDGLGTGGRPAARCTTRRPTVSAVSRSGLTLFDLSATRAGGNHYPTACGGAAAHWRGAGRPGYNLGLVGRAASGGIRAVPTVLAGGRSPAATIGSVTATRSVGLPDRLPDERTGSG